MSADLAFFVLAEFWAALIAVGHLRRRQHFNAMGDIEREVEFGLEQIAPDRKVELSLRDALYAYKAIGEFIRFFHDPDQHPTIEQVKEFLGNRFEGGLHVLWEAYYERLRNAWPPDVKKALDDGLLDRNPFLDE